jgi:hypothetical protein
MKTKIIFSVSILTLLLLSVGCEKELSGIEFGQEFKLAYNQKATIIDEQTGERLEVKIEVDPYPILNKITHKHDYVATLKIIK